MIRSDEPVRRASPAALAILLGVLVLVSVVMDGGAESTPPVSVAVIGGRKMMPGVDQGSTQRTMKDFKADDPFQSSKRRVPNGPDPIHNRGTGKSGRSPGRV